MTAQAALHCRFDQQVAAFDQVAVVAAVVVFDPRAACSASATDPTVARIGSQHPWSAPVYRSSRKFAYVSSSPPESLNSALVLQPRGQRKQCQSLFFGNPCWVFALNVLERSHHLGIGDEGLVLREPCSSSYRELCRGLKGRLAIFCAHLRNICTGPMASAF